MTTIIAGWSLTKLWTELNSRASADNSRLTLQNCMPLIESSLRSGGTCPINFTLHDDGHGFRVAERMAELCINGMCSKLSNTEIALLILSAYLHDIGMNPIRSKANNHWKYIITSEQGLLSQTEIEVFQQWLDAKWNGITLPIAHGIITSSNLEMSEEVFSYYCREMHNDWSEEWIRDKLADMHPGLYPSWIDDLVTLCRSHHEGLAELRSHRFDAKIVGTPSQIVNLRYLAALLRISDILEFDPERTPSIILEHRDVPASSRIYWHKDQHISFHLVDDGSRMLFTARTPNAAIHKAILDTSFAIDNELLCCSTLEHEGAYRHGIVSEADRGKYIWPWPSKLTMDVLEKDHSFVFINGAFRPDTKRILDLLSGTHLYGHIFAAIRELLQNSIDAIQEQVAYERLQQDNPSDAKYETILGSLHRVKLSLEYEDDRFWLSCSDDGIGMTKHVIENCLLVSGANARPEIRSLERSTKANGFDLGRTGQFGIGVLSYFMIADYMEITTRRSPEAGDSDNAAWRFKTYGVGDFGELAKVSRSSRGTMVRLRLKIGLIDNDGKSPQDAGDHWFSSLLAYIQSAVRKVPCRLEVVNAANPSSGWQVEPGWTTNNTNDYKSNITAGLVASSVNRPKLSTESERELFEREDQRWLSLQSLATKAIKFYGPFETILPDRLGQARFWLPYYELDGGSCLAFMDIDDDSINPMPDGRDAYVSQTSSYTSWKGFSVYAKIDNIKFLIVEVNLTSGSEINVNRGHIKIDNKETINAFLKMQQNVILNKFLDDFKESKFNLFNIALASRTINLQLKSTDLPEVFYWKHAQEDGQHSKWSQCKFPILDHLIAPYASESKLIGPLFVKFASVLQGISLDKYDRIRLSSILPNGSLCFAGTHFLMSPICLTWRDTNFTSEKPHSFAVDYPHEWSLLSSITTNHRILLNSAHPLVASLARDSKISLPLCFDPDCIERILANKSLLNSWLLFALNSSWRKWTLLKEKSEKVYKNIIHEVERCFGVDKLVVFRLGSYRETCTIVIDIDGVHIVEDPITIKGIKIYKNDILYWPNDKEWWVTISPMNDQGESFIKYHSDLIKKT